MTLENKWPEQTEYYHDQGLRRASLLTVGVARLIVETYACEYHSRGSMAHSPNMDEEMIQADQKAELPCHRS